MSLKVYSDGGVVGRNPSATGGTWAYCCIGIEYGAERIRAAASGLITPGSLRHPHPVISNNFTELYAAVRAVEAAVHELGWDGVPPKEIPQRERIVLYTDSQVTQFRMTESASFKNVPGWLEQSAVRVRRYCKKVVLLGGHPTKEELAAGRDSRGLLTSKWNCWCDRQCRELATQIWHSIKVG